MGIARPVANFLAGHCRDKGITGNCLTLGRQVVNFNSFFGFELAARYGLMPVTEGEIRIEKGHPVIELIASGRMLADYGPYRNLNISDEAFFKILGFKAIKSLDINDYEGCDYVFDLNKTPGSSGLNEKFDLVYDGGTIEHVFNVANAFGNVFELTNVGGYVIHESPVNNFVDHGFYQFSPTLLTDYYHANQWDILDVRLLQFARDVTDPTTGLWRDKFPYFYTEYTPNSRSELQMNQLLDARYGVQILVRKTEKSTYDRTPYQGYYKNVWR